MSAWTPGVNRLPSITLITYFVNEIISIWLVAVSFGYNLSFFELSSTSCSRLILYFSWPSPGISRFSKEPGLVLVKMVFRSQDLDAGVLTAIRGRPPSPSQWAGHGNVAKCTHAHTK